MLTESPEHHQNTSRCPPLEQTYKALGIVGTRASGGRKFIFRHGMIFISQCEKKSCHGLAWLALAKKIMPWPARLALAKKNMPWLGPAGVPKKNMPWLQSQAGIIHIAYDFSEPAVLGPLRACPKNNAGEK